MPGSWLVALAGTTWLAAAPPTPAAPPLAETYLHDGTLTAGEKALADHLRRTPADDQARFGLGVLQVVRAVERLGQALHRYGLRSDRGQQLGVPFLRLPVPANPTPAALSYPAARRVVQDLADDLARAEATLAGITDGAVKLRLRVGRIRLDLTGAGRAGDSFSGILLRYLGGGRNAPADADWPVALDRGDVAWLRGYCHLLMALAEAGLAHDGQELFDGTAHLFFARAETPHAFLTKEAPDGPLTVGGVNLVDAIALVHLLRLPVAEPGRMAAALAHLERTLALSKESWAFILAEDDDDHEWLPSPRQTGVLGVPVRREMIDGWLAMAGEGEALLAGKKLVPFWRGDGRRGVNLRRVFTEPRPLDLVLWVQGTAAAPYLEGGPLTEPGVWDRLLRVFGGEFVGFAFWFN